MTDTLISPAREAASFAASIAAQNDRDGAAPELEDTLARLGELGALDVPGIPGHVQVLRAVAAECLCTVFSIWAQRMVIEYLDASPNAALTPLREELAAGRRAGSIAMATAMQELAGVGQVPTVATPDGDGYRVSGRIAWASNIVPGTAVVFPAKTADGAGRVILAAIAGDEGLSAKPVRGLLALDATRSSMLAFDEVRVPAERVVADSFDAAVDQRTTHYLTQTAFCLGITQRCLDEASALLDGPGRVLEQAHADLGARLAALDDRTRSIAADTWDASPVEVTRLRLEAALLALEGARLESTLAGGRGFVTTSAVNRRLREASFLPVQSPSEVQLRWELARLEE